MRLRRNQVIPERHTEFSSLLFDVLFGFLVFVGVESLFDLRGAQPILLVIAAIVVAVHWWLKYKAADETYSLEVGNSAFDLLFGLIEIVLLQSAITAAARGLIVQTAFYFSLPLLTEAVWALFWRFFGRWRRTSRERIAFMEQQLETTIFLNLGAAAALGALIANGQALSSPSFLILFGSVYALYVFFTARWELVDLKWF